MNTMIQRQTIVTLSTVNTIGMPVVMVSCNHGISIERQGLVIEQLCPWSHIP